MLGELAAAFERKDATRVRELIVDGWSGSQFMAGWADANWAAAATALRSATLKSATDTVRVYTLVHENKEVSVTLIHGSWLLDYNEFRGPFPHM